MNSGEMAVPTNVQESSLEAIVIRCGCGDPSSHLGTVCPTPRSREDLGVIAYYHRNPLRRWAWMFNKRVREWKERIEKWKFQN